MARISTSGSRWAIVFLGTVVSAFGVLFLAAPDAVQVGEPAVVGTAMLGGGPAIAAFGAGAVRRTNGRFGGRGWTVVGFVIVIIAAVVVGIRAGDGLASAAGLLGIGAAGLFVVAAGVTISRGVLARRMSATTGAPADLAGRGAARGDLRRRRRRNGGVPRPERCWENRPPSRCLPASSHHRLVL